MGSLHYAGTNTFHFEDRLLTHLRSVILGKLAMQESFAFTWSDGTAQRSVWFHPALPLEFEFESESTPEINPSWIEVLAALANSPGGLRIAAEPEQS